MSLQGTQLNLVTSTDEAAEFKRWLGERHENDAVAVDTETTGLNPRAPKAGVRLIQFGDTKTGWAIPWLDWRGLALETLNQYEGTWIYHNIAFETKWIHEHSDYRLPRSRSVDTMIGAHIINPLGSGALKGLSVKYVDPKASAGQNLLQEGFAKHGWDWATVPVDYEPYWSYSALDTVLTAQLWDKFKGQLTGAGAYRDVFDLEMAVRFIVSGMEERGARVDLDYSQEWFTKLNDDANAVSDWAEGAFGINIASNKQLGETLVRYGGELFEFTATGQPKVDKYTLDILSDPDNAYPAAVQTLATQALRLRGNRKFASTYFANFLSQNVDGYIHADIRTLGARTGRMCIPDRHELVTDRGRVSVDQISVGDQTPDLDGNWTTVRAVHRYAEQPTTVWAHEYATLECTDEHRWVTISERGKQQIEPLGARARQTVQLAPQTEKFDFSVLDFDATTDDEVFAAIVGLLVTDGRCSDSSATGVGMRAYIYQTEKKFYQQIMNLLPPESVMYDRVTKHGDAHHEIRLRTRWLRERLSDAGLHVPADSSLRHSENLPAWVMRISTRAASQFLRAVWLADGRSGYPSEPVMSCTSSSETREAVRLAAYRLGYSTSVSTTPPSPWGTQDRVTVGFKKSAWSTRWMTRTPSTADVWCVTTDSGTFTAWSPEYGPYLTGNSVGQPALQQLPKNSSLVRNAFIPRDGNVLVTTDYSQIEMRGMAEASEDPGLLEAFHKADATGGDFFVEMGKIVYNEPGFTKADKRRGLLKNTFYGKAYGAGPAKMAESAGIPIARMEAVVETVDARFPGLKAFMTATESLGVERERKEGEAYVITPLGRRLPADKGKIYALTNYYLQSWAADVLKKSLVRLDAAGYDEYMILPVHDEIVMDIPKEHAEQALRDVPLIMQELDHDVPLTAESEGPLDRWGQKYL